MGEPPNVLSNNIRTICFTASARGIRQPQSRPSKVLTPWTAALEAILQASISPQRSRAEWIPRGSWTELGGRRRTFRKLVIRSAFGQSAFSKPSLVDDVSP